ncbi:DUF6427 family protein [Ichthyenterobacterium sp. W332]|uniref:DUF6427 family protein n=1 Tax=Microcosmobacter mediterraneus TaxID=3075607 RepID=A0ABU2YJT4_9FLAO|nr:DUF6427 family protein [Ichthyenterobacterium sp. W332]MDT0558075.1 DUF6427 family protein [Ichthyenterobacterium sp. W332]
MISRFFNKSKPIHNVIVLLLIVLVFVSVKWEYLFSGIGVKEILQQVFFLLVSLFSIFLLEFIVTKNNLSKKNAYTILIYGLLIAILPYGLKNSYVLLSNIFILFALRRLITLQSKLEIKKKLFDATFWIILASLLNFWAILFLFLVVIALLYSAENNSKNWLIPVMTILTVAILYISFQVIVNDQWIAEDFSNIPSLNFDFSAYNSSENILSITLVFSMLIWSSIYYFKKTKEVNRTSKSAFILVGITALIALVISIISPQKDGSEFFYLFAPLAIIMTNYLEQVSDVRFKEVLLLILVLAPILNLVL